MICNCSKPRVFSDPRYDGRCQECHGTVVRKPPKAAICKRCGHRFSFSEAYMVGFSRENAMQWSHFCAECSESLRAWAGIRPGEPLTVGGPRQDLLPYP